MMRTGRIDFVNSDPVYHGIESGVVDTDIKLIKGFPTALNSMLFHGDLDIAPISSIEYARNYEKYRILPDLSVSSRSRVGSILFFTTKEPSELGDGVVAVSSTSATSIELLDIVLRKRYGVNLEFKSMDPGLESMMDEADAAMIIGDHALKANIESREREGIRVFDLGVEWHELTGERMVYALWAVREEIPDEKALRAARDLKQSKKIGYENLGLIADRLADRMDISKSYADEYLRLLDHDFTDEHIEGLMKYYGYAEEIDKIRDTPELRLIKK